MIKSENRINAKKLVEELKALYNPVKATQCLRFFKTGKGQYGEGDQFIGLTQPVQRSFVKKYAALTLTEIEKLLKNKFHEMRMVGLLILVHQYERAKHEPAKQLEIYKFYIKNIAAANNWDLIDVTTPKVIGKYMLGHPLERKKIYKWVKSKNLWHRRISMMACFPLIDTGEFSDALQICKLLINDKQDLIHKATGWMLREIGKKDLLVLRKFLDQNVKQMPRTMLRYAIEKLPEKERRGYLNA